MNQFWILSSAERRRGGDPESTMCSFLPHLDQDSDCAGRSHPHFPGSRLSSPATAVPAQMRELAFS